VPRVLTNFGIGPLARRLRPPREYGSMIERRRTGLSHGGLLDMEYFRSKR
jgi:hypothetical protein